MRTTYNKPANEQDFELFCLELLREHWKKSQLQLYSCRGLGQHGVDVIDVNGEEPLHAAQCKLHEETKNLAPAELKAEVEKAEKFSPPIASTHS